MVEILPVIQMRTVLVNRGHSLTPSVGEGAIRGNAKRDAIGNGYFPVERVSPATGEEDIALVQHG